MQEFVPFYCIHDHAPYLAVPLKLDNLRPKCKDVSEKALRGSYMVFQVAGIYVMPLW